MTFDIPAPQSRLKSYCELLRLPNVFTAIADVLMGYLFANPVVEGSPSLVLLVVASSGLYLAGMVLNDVFDYSTDLAERPTRPLPSGRISLSTAKVLGYTLLLVGLASGWAISALMGEVRTGIVATLLGANVWLYDYILKRTVLGPVAMGSCRMLNVLMGMSLRTTGSTPDMWIAEVTANWTAANWTVAAGIGVYVAGVTWLARREAGRSSRVQLALATIVMMLGLAALAGFPWAATETERLIGRFNQAYLLGTQWFVVWALLAASIAFRCVLAVQLPVAARVQTAVKRALVSLIVIDAVITVAVHGSYSWAPALLLLLIPTVLIGRWIYST